MESGFDMSIEAGCNGVEASIILVSAILAFPRGIKNKILGVCFGLVSLHFLNVVRIISLFYLGQWSEVAFDWAHLYIWQALIMLDVFIVFIFWVRYSQRSKGNNFEE
jgi:exosortase H (IPTLxxWG-CTERM-specific)